MMRPPSRGFISELKERVVLGMVGLWWSVARAHSLSATGLFWALPMGF